MNKKINELIDKINILEARINSIEDKICTETEPSNILDPQQK